MRVLVFILAFSGCQLIGQNDAIEPGIGSGSGNGSGLGPAECMIDSECVAVGVKCCDCPTYAVPAADPAHRACAGIACPLSQCSQNLRAACVAHACVLACAPIVCAASCTDGYATDAAGCLTCACAMPANRGCFLDSECQRVRADCCGCQRGGTDTAVPHSQADAHDLGLMCPSVPSCPSVDTCAPDLAPTCVQGTCQLISGGLPAQACGRPDLPACTGGAVCTLNASTAATLQGVGVCAPP